MNRGIILYEKYIVEVMFWHKRALGGGERIFCLYYGWVVQAHSNHNNVIKL